jgi:hypothetical protein
MLQAISVAAGDHTINHRYESDLRFGSPLYRVAVEGPHESNQVSTPFVKGVTIESGTVRVVEEKQPSPALLIVSPHELDMRLVHIETGTLLDAKSAVDFHAYAGELRNIVPVRLDPVAPRITIAVNLSPPN